MSKTCDCRSSSDWIWLMLIVFAIHSLTCSVDEGIRELRAIKQTLTAPK